MLFQYYLTQGGGFETVESDFPRAEDSLLRPVSMSLKLLNAAKFTVFPMSIPELGHP